MPRRKAVGHVGKPLNAAKAAGSWSTRSMIIRLTLTRLAQVTLWIGLTTTLFVLLDLYT
jgi:hypothetical protein